MMVRAENKHVAVCVETVVTAAEGADMMSLNVERAACRFNSEATNLTGKPVKAL